MHAPHNAGCRTVLIPRLRLRSAGSVDELFLAGEFVDQRGQDLQDESCPPEVRSLGRTIVRWRDQIVAWHEAMVSNGPTEAVNNLIGIRARRGGPHRIRRRLPTDCCGQRAAEATNAGDRGRPQC